MIVLEGCRRQPLGSYLQALGAWRAIVRLLDPQARGHWDGGRFVLTTAVPADELLDRLADTFEPLPLVSPWNEGAGFKPGGSPAKALAEVLKQNDARWAQLQAAIRSAEEVVTLGLALGWGSEKASELWSKDYKPLVMQLCRNSLPDDALAWLDAAVVLGPNKDGDLDKTLSRLLGTGGNFGRQDLQTTYLQRALAVLADQRTAWRSRDWLRAALFGEEDVPYLREAVGQFDPGRAGGIQSSPAEKSDHQGFANPWAFLLATEGTLLFASAATRRQGARNVSASFPFMVRSTPVGHASTAPNEKALGEIWTPEWDRPASLPEIAHLLGEGRADWRGRPARSGLDFARAVATLGVDRGVRRFTRYGFVERLGQNPLAIPLGIVDVRERPGTALLAQLDSWLNGVRKVEGSAAVAVAARGLESAMFDQARGATGLADVLIAAGALHDAVSRSGAARRDVPPLRLTDSPAWCAELDSSEPEMRLAIALASARDAESTGGLRELLTPVRDEGRRLTWTDRPALVQASASLCQLLAAAHRRRALPGAVKVPKLTDDADAAPAVQGVFTAWQRGVAPLAEDVAGLVNGWLDEQRLRALLGGLLLLDWRNMPKDPLVQRPASRKLLPPPLALLLPFFAAYPLRVRLRADDPAPTPLVLRPGAGWIAQLAAGAVEPVLRDAALRLRAAGIPGVVNVVSATGVDGERLAAGLLVPLLPSDRVAALAAVAALPRSTETKSLHEGVPV